jgi:5-methylcytosine-specific restriction protein A
MVDHITPICAGGTDEDSNLQSMCRYCHARKTSRENPVRRDRERQSGYEHS